MEKTIGQILHRIQKELKAPKGQTNSFGNYKYRSAEDILVAVKSCLQDGEYMTISDQIHVFGDRFYVSATATLRHKDEYVDTVAYAREEETKKGMDAAQITGSASSYARKYALNGLFCIDDTKDADSMDNSQEKPRAEEVDKFTPEHRALQAEVITRFSQCSSNEEIDSVLDEYSQQITELPDGLSEVVNEQINNSRDFIRKGGKPEIKYHKFPSVDAAILWATNNMKAFKSIPNIKMLDEWESRNRPFFNGLDCLKAQKYLKDGKSPKERFLQALMDKRVELESTQAPIG